MKFYNMPLSCRYLKTKKRMAAQRAAILFLVFSFVLVLSNDRYK